MAKEQCSMCRFWSGYFESKTEPEKGQCRRFPPALLHRNAQRIGSTGRMLNYGEQPITTSYDWCGEFKEKD